MDPTWSVEFGPEWDEFNDFVVEVSGIIVCDHCVRGHRDESVETECDYCEARIRTGKEKLRHLRDALRIPDENDAVIDTAALFLTMEAVENFTKCTSASLVQASCLYLTCREKNHPFLLSDFSNYLQQSINELSSVYLKLCQILGIKDKHLDTSVVIPTSSTFDFPNKAVIVAEIHRALHALESPTFLQNVEVALGALEKATALISKMAKTGFPNWQRKGIRGPRRKRKSYRLIKRKVQVYGS